MAIDSPSPLAKQADLGDLSARLWSARIRILLVALTAGLLALGAAFLFPKWYRAQAVILPPEETDLLSNMSLASRALSKFPTFGMLGDYFTPADVFRAILKSRTLQDEIIDRFDLQRVYRQKSREKTLKELKGHYDVKLAPDGRQHRTPGHRSPGQQSAAEKQMASSGLQQAPASPQTF